MSSPLQACCPSRNLGVYGRELFEELFDSYLLVCAHRLQGKKPSRAPRLHNRRAHRLHGMSVDIPSLFLTIGLRVRAGSTERRRSAERLGAPPDTTRVALRRGHPCIATVQRNPAPPASGSIPFSPVPSNTRRGNRPIGSGPPGPPAAASLSLPSPSRSGAPSGCRVWFIARRAVAGRRSNSRAGAAIDILAPAPLISATSLAAGRRAGGGTAARLIDGNCGRSPRSAIDRYERGTTLGSW
jgi:hypothetical protein